MSKEKLEPYRLDRQDCSFYEKGLVPENGDSHILQ
mgnify:CR=1 FL=1